MRSKNIQITLLSFIIGLTASLSNFAFADQLAMRYSGIWSNTMNIQWTDKDGYTFKNWTQWYAKEVTKDGTTQCKVFCKATTSTLLGISRSMAELQCGIISLNAALGSAELNTIYNHLVDCKIENGKVIWPMYNEVYETYQKTGKDKIVTFHDDEDEGKPQEMEHAKQNP